MTTTSLINDKTNPFTNKKALILSIRLSIPFNAIMLLGIFYNTNISLRLIIAPITYMILSNIFLFYILLVFNFNIIQQKWNPKTQFAVLIIGNIAISVVFSLTFSNLLFLFASESILVKKGYIVINMIKDLVVVMMAQITTLLAYSSKKELETAIIHERLITENIRTRYEVLKGQVDPHFIFNSLNTLDGLIGVNDEDAHGYLQNFSSVFRYVLNNKEITHLSDELTFTESYATLMKIRYGDNFKMEYHIDEKYKTWFIMPISLQLLVENAIKHNVISKNYPLLVTIETTLNDTIRVKNAINQKKEPEQGEGIGLANLTDRYNLLFQKEVLITQTDVFSVEIPLIKQLDKSKINYK